MEFLFSSGKFKVFFMVFDDDSQVNLIKRLEWSEEETRKHS